MNCNQIQNVYETLFVKHVSRKERLLYLKLMVFVLSEMHRNQTDEILGKFQKWYLKIYTKHMILLKYHWISQYLFPRNKIDRIIYKKEHDCYKKKDFKFVIKE